jgi:hypothetical protein
MSDALVILNPGAIEALERLAGTLAQSSLMPDPLKGKPRDVLVTLMTGAELGLKPMQSIRGISIIKGKAQLSADLMAALCLRHTDICKELGPVESTDEKCVMEAQRVGQTKRTMSFTMADAKKAGLADSHMYHKFPKAMLRARCTSAICKAVFPDLTQGLYDSDSGELTNGEPPEGLLPEEEPLPEKDITPVATEAAPKEKKAKKTKEAPSPTPAVAAAFGLMPEEQLRKLTNQQLTEKISIATDWLYAAGNAAEPIEEKTKAKAEAKLEQFQKEAQRRIEAEMGVSP